MAFQTNALPMVIRERAAARLTKFAGLGLDTVFWINSGAEANENALKLAFKLTGRQQGRGSGTELPRQNRSRGSRDLGRRRKMVRLPPRALRCELYARATIPSLSSNVSIERRPR